MFQPLAIPTTKFTKAPPFLPSVTFLLIICILGFYTVHHPHTENQHPHNFQHAFLSSASNYTVASYLRDLTLHPHLAGTESSIRTTNFVQTHFKSLGLDTHVVPYRALLSYPLHSEITVHFSDGRLVILPVIEKGLDDGGLEDVVRPYHAYSPSGSVYAKVVFVNYGREDDYHALGEVGVQVNGCIVLARGGGGLSRGKVVEIAESKGAVAVLRYVEEGDGLRGGVGGIERGTVMRGVGDPLSPGWAGFDHSESLDLEDSVVVKRFPKIPSMPLSEESAEIILGSLEGPEVPKEWKGTLRSNVVHVGPGPTELNFTYQGEKRMATVHDVFAVIRGVEEPDRYVILGNHRDAWTFGAVDPNSGTAALLDIARRFSLLMRLGWSPRRTVILCSWDAEEFGMIGSTEWVEQNRLNLFSKAVAYLNVDCAVQGPGLFTGATPQLDDLLTDVTKKVNDPDSEHVTLYETWTATNNGIDIQRLSGVDSDFVSFLHHTGVPCVDLYFGKDFPVYHTAFDSYDWMTTYGDPLFHRHVAAAGVWGLLALRLADDLILPFNYLTYANQLQGYNDAVSNIVDGSISLHPLTSAIEELANAAEEVENEIKTLREQNQMGNLKVLKVRDLNDRLMLAERGFLDEEGLKGKQWFKHLVYGPTSDAESKLAYFPGVADALSRATEASTRKKKAKVQHEIWRVARAIERAASTLKGELS